MRATIYINSVLCDYHTRLPLSIEDRATALMGIDSVIHSDINLMDSVESVKKAMNRSPRDIYIDSLKGIDSSGNLDNDYIKNRKRALVGLTSYLNENPNLSPEH